MWFSIFAKRYTQSTPWVLPLGGKDGLVGVALATVPSPVIVMVEPAIHGFSITPEGE